MKHRLSIKEEQKLAELLQRVYHSNDTTNEVYLSRLDIAFKDAPRRKKKVLYRKRCIQYHVVMLLDKLNHHHHLDKPKTR